MLSNFKLILGFFFLLLISITASGQSETRIYQDAAEYMRTGQYDLAIEAFAYIDHIPGVPYEAAICSLLSKQHHRVPMSELEVFEKDGDELYYYWLGKVHLKRFHLEAAQESFNQFLQTTGRKSKYESYAKEAKQLQNYLGWQNEAVKIQAMENPINSQYDELSALIYAEGKKMIFISDRVADEEFAVYQTELGPYGWDAPKMLSENAYNTESFSLVANRESLFQFSNGQIYTLTLDEMASVSTNSMSISGLEKAHHLYINKYQTRIIFSKENGTNGLDIYEAFKLRSTGEWMTPVSISESINSTYDEDYPFLSEDGKTLYFSSNRKGGLGQYDVYVVRFDDENNVWGTPVNAGIPINSSDQDIDFRLFNDQEGSLSSDRVYSSGDLDIFMIRFSENALEPLLTGH